MTKRREEYVNRLLDEALASGPEQRIPFAVPGDKLLSSQALERLIEKVSAPPEPPAKPKRASSPERDKVRDELSKRLTPPTEMSREDQLEFDTDREMAARDRRNRALVTNGDDVLVPGPEDWSIKGAGNLALEGINRFGEAALAMPPSLGPPGAVIHGLGQVMKFPSSTLKHMTGMKPPVAQSSLDEAAQASQRSYDELLGRLQSIDPSYRAPSAIGEPDYGALTKGMQGDLGAFESRIAPRTGGSVPAAGNPGAMDEVFDAAADVASRPYHQSAPGKQGFASPEEFADIMRRGAMEGRTFDDMGSPGPWGRNIPEARREFVGREREISKTGRDGRPMKEPATEPQSVEYIAQLRDKIQQLEERKSQAYGLYNFANKKNLDHTRAIKGLNEEIEVLKSLLRKFVGPGDPSMKWPPTE